MNPSYWYLLRFFLAQAGGDTGIIVGFSLNCNAPDDPATAPHLSAEMVD